MNIRAGDLLMALRLAIIDQRKAEAGHGFTRDSAFIAGLEDAYKHIQSGGQIQIVPSNKG